MKLALPLPPIRAQLGLGHQQGLVLINLPIHAVSTGLIFFIIAVREKIKEGVAWHGASCSCFIWISEGESGIWWDLAKMENVKGGSGTKNSCYWARVWLLGQKSGLQYPLGSLEITSVLIDVCLFSFGQTLFPAAWMFWQSLIFSLSFFLPISSLLSSWHKQNSSTTQRPLAFDPHILRSCTWEKNSSVLSSISSCTEKDTLSFTAPWAWYCCTLRSWMSEITVKWGSFCVSWFMLISI